MVERGLRRIAQGGDFPTLVPYRYGERSPYWEERLTAQWVQVNGDETADEWFAGALAGVLAVLFGGSVRLKNRVRRLKTLRSGSRTLDQVLFATAVATVTGLELTVEEGLDASLLGAIRLASQSAWVAITRGVDGHLRYAPEPGQEAFWEARWQIISQAAAKQLDAMGLPPSPR
jgi:sugar (pentulose or hexulose) kinase